MPRDLLTLEETDSWCGTQLVVLFATVETFSFPIGLQNLYEDKGGFCKFIICSLQVTRCFPQNFNPVADILKTIVEIKKGKRIEKGSYFPSL